MKLIAREPTQEMVDAARYRWLRNEAMAQEIKAPIAVMADHAGRICYHNGLPEWLGGEELDRYIDAWIEPSNVWFSDAAPEIQQEPVGYVREIRPGEWKFSKTTSWGPDVWPPVYQLPPDAQEEIDKRDARIKELTDALTDMRGFVSTNTNREMTLKDRFFSAHADFVADNNFDFDAGLLVSGDFVGEEKNEYARMIACTLNDYAKQAAQIEELAAQNQQLREQLQMILDADYREWEDLASPDEFVRWAKSRANYMLQLPDLASPVLNRVKAEANVEPPIPVAPGKEDASFEHWYETKFKPAMERGPFDRYVARQAWFASKAYAIEKGEKG